jgi:hypothetical protein
LRENSDTFSLRATGFLAPRLTRGAISRPTSRNCLNASSRAGLQQNIFSLRIALPTGHEQQNNKLSVAGTQEVKEFVRKMK